MASSKLIRPLVHALHAYVPGEQPKVKGLIKLNTNENPYPPSPKVLKATKAAVDGRLRLYPNPTAQALRDKLAKLHGCAPENIIVGNGSDEVLAQGSQRHPGSSRSLPLPLPPPSLLPLLPLPCCRSVPQTRPAPARAWTMPTAATL